MKKLLSIIFALIMLITIASPVIATGDDQAAKAKIPIVEVQVGSEAEARVIYQAGLDIIGFTQLEDVYYFQIMVKDFEREYFAQHGTQYSVVQEDATAQVEWLGYQEKSGFTLFSADDPQPIPGLPQNGNNVIAQPSLTVNPDAVFDPTGVLFDAKYGFPMRLGYRTVTEYYAESNYLALAYPELVKKHIIGRSYEGVPMIAIEISNAPGSFDGRPGTVHQAGNHAREWPTNELALNTMWYLVTQYGKNERVTKLLDTTTCWFLPATNPDGTNYDQRTSPGSWRKNRRANGGTSYGVDVNRNWPYGWGSNNGSSSSTTSDTYRGTASASEYEVQAVTSLYENYQILTSISGHTSGQLIIYAWGHKFNQPNTNPLLAALGREISDYNLHADQFSESLYAASGDLCDYAYGAVGALHYTIEHYRSFVPNYNGTQMYRGYTAYNDLFQGTRRNFPVTYSTAAQGRAPAQDLTAPVGFIDDPNLFRTGYGGADTLMTVAKVNALPDGFLAGKIFITPQGSSNTITRDVILAAQAKGAVGVLFCGASSGNYSGGYAHYTPSFGTAGIAGIAIPVAGTNKGYVRELYERAKAGEPNALTLTGSTENTESMYWQFERQIGAYMHNMDAARAYAAHISGSITDGKGIPVSGATLNLEVVIENMVQASNSGTGDPGSPLRYLPLGTLTSKHKSTYAVEGSSYDWSVVPSVQPALADFPIPEKPFTVTASASGRYSDKKDVMVRNYKEVVGNQNFGLPPVFSTDFAFKPGMDTSKDISVTFNAYNKNGTPFTGKLTALLNGASVSVEGSNAEETSGALKLSSVAAGVYVLTFNLDALGIDSVYDATLTLSIESADEYTPLVISGSSAAEDPVVDLPVVMDEAGAPYADGGATFVSGAVDVFIRPEPDTTYYYKVGGSKNGLDVFYNGEPYNPSGSYFSGPLTSGALVMSLGEGLDYVSGTLVSGNKITVPATPGEAAVLEVIAYKGGVASEVFTYEFRCGTPTGMLFKAAYAASGYMASAELIGYKASNVMDLGFFEYPLGEYYYKVFCWDENYVPLFDALTFK